MKPMICDSVEYRRKKPRNNRITFLTFNVPTIIYQKMNYNGIIMVDAEFELGISATWLNAFVKLEGAFCRLSSRPEFRCGSIMFHSRAFDEEYFIAAPINI